MDGMDWNGVGSLEFSVPEFEEFFQSHELEFMLKYRKLYKKDISGMRSWPCGGAPGAVTVFRDDRTGCLKYKW